MGKLVRDKIPRIIEESGSEAVTSSVKGREYVERLHDKLQEEVKEFLEKGEMEELADVLEVICAICGAEGMSFEELEDIRKKKREERGGFEEGIILKDG